MLSWSDWPGRQPVAFDIDQSVQDLKQASFHLHDDHDDVPDIESSYAPHTSNFFSAARHHARTSSAFTSKPSLTPSNAAEALQFSNLVMENEDDVMIEARALLTQWVSNPALPEPSDDASNCIKLNLNLGAFMSLEEKLCGASDRKAVREVVEEVVGCGNTKGSALYARTHQSSISPYSRHSETQNRHALARERREQHHKHRLQALERQIESKQQKLLSSLRQKHVERVRPKPSKIDQWKMDIALRAARAALDEDMGRERSDKPYGSRNEDFERARDRVVDEEYARMRTTADVLTIADVETGAVEVENTELNDNEAQLKTESQKEDEKRRNEVIERRLAESRARAEELFSVRRLKALKVHFSSWCALVTTYRKQVQQFQVITTWRQLNRSFATWRKRRQSCIAKREAQALQEALQKSHENQLKAVRFQRSTILSKVVLGWLGWTRLQREAKRLRRQHEERAKRMKEVLERLERRQRVEAEIEERRVDKVLEGLDASASGEILSHDESKDVSATMDGEDMNKGSTASMEEPEAPNPAPTEENKGVCAAALNDLPKELTVRHKAPSPKKPRSIRTARDQKWIAEMEKRDAERRDRRQQLEQRRKERQEALEAKKAAEAEAKALQEAEERRILIESRKAAEKALAEQLAQQRQLNALACTFSRKRLLRTGLKCMKAFVGAVRRNEEASLGFWVHCLYKVWIRRLRERWEEREMMASKQWARRAVKSGWDRWKEAYETHKHQISDARKHHKNHVLLTIFQTWRRKALTTSQTREALERALNAKADQLMKRILPRRCLRLWKEFVAEQKEHRWREFRKQVLRERVKEILHHSRFEAKLEMETIAGQEVDE
ncbi:hypothetical protein SpCBS45565_g04826 [Spizellomyces sp. 'palustris']|nr:hypothetical protein SpCBS45565_g04826 [Spizellomyces sp. 'palustris']